MRMIGAASLVAVCGMLAGAPAQAQWWLPPFKGNDTGGIIAYPLAAQTDVRQLAVDHCASYGKVVKFLAVDPHYGGYISFACRWVPYGAAERPLRTYYCPITVPFSTVPFLGQRLTGSAAHDATAPRRSGRRSGSAPARPTRSPATS